MSNTISISRSMLALKIIFMCAQVTCAEVFYITSTPHGPCPSASLCTTLTTFSQHHLPLLNNSFNVSLTFLPGKHSLHQWLHFFDKNEIVMTSYTNDAVFIECKNLQGSFAIENTTFVLMRDLHFIGCDANRVINTENLILEKITFQGAKAYHSAKDVQHYFALNLSNVQFVKIEESTFLSTRGAVYFELCTVWISSCQVVSNTGNSNIVVYRSTLYCENCTFAHHNVMSYAQIEISYSIVIIHRSNFHNNTGSAIVVYRSNLQCENSTFAHNKQRSLGLISITNSTITIKGSEFYKNEGTAALLFASEGTYINIHNCQFLYNSGKHNVLNSAVMFVDFSNVTIQNSSFDGNYAELGSGVISSGQCTIFIQNSSFVNNSASINGGGVIDTTSSTITIQNCNFSYNQVHSHIGVGGAIRSHFDTYFIANSNFSHNSASEGGVMSVITSFVTIVRCSLNNNMAKQYGGVVSSTAGSILEINNSSMSNNTAGLVSGAILVFRSSVILNSITLNNNSAGHNSGAVFCSEGLVGVDKSTFNKNRAPEYGGIMLATNCNVNISNCHFCNNLGSFYTFISQVYFTGSNLIEYGSEIINSTSTKEQEGGAISSFESTVTFIGTISLLKNTARNGGAILATASRIIMYGDIIIANNSAISNSGGGVVLRQSVLEVRGVCQVCNNDAWYGGGIQVSGSHIFVYDQYTAGLHLIDNTADYQGGGMYFNGNSKLYLLKYAILYETEYTHLVSFTRNDAVYGGAVYVEDDSNSCSPANECFIQALSTTPYTYNILSAEDIVLYGNTATERGSDLFGGQIYTCSVNKITNIFRSKLNIRGHEYYKFTNFTSDTVASDPVRVCFCTKDGQTDCDYNHPPVHVKKGETFSVSLVAVDQVNNTVDTKFTSVFTGDFIEGRVNMTVGKHCYEFQFTMFSPNDVETVHIYAQGPCADYITSTRSIEVKFINCTCPIGFEPRAKATKNCECICDSKLSPYVSNCNPSTESLLIRGDAWIFHSNETIPPGYVVHPHCPLDYCHSPSKSIRINLNLPNGSDSQCAYNHRGVLCGSCSDNFSLSLGSSRCLHCEDHWPAVFVAIVFAATTSGILLVVFMLILNFTVTAGFINGLIFYANIVASSRAVFFPSSQSSFPNIFVAWLNLDIGIDVCFFKGLDMYTKTWIQLVFPVYIILLVVMVIVVSEHSLRFTTLIGKKNPVATLATLVLLSYAKLLSTTITILSYTIINYPDGSKVTVWLPDANVKYFQGKHTALCIAAILIILLGVPYTLLLFLWQWLVRVPKWKVFKWTRNTKLNAFIATYHAPYNSRHRYWTGLLLLVRVILYITASVTAFSTPQSLPLITAILIGGLLFVKGILGARLYKKSIVDIFDSVIYANLLAFALLTPHNFKSDVTKQTVIAYISTTITLLLLLGAITYHVFVLIISKKKKSMFDEDPSPLQCRPAIVAAVVTHSTIEMPPIERQLNAVPLMSIESSDTVDQRDTSTHYHAMI